MGTMVKDRRRYRRVPRSRELAVFKFTDEHEKPGMVRGRLADISAGGAAIHSNVAPSIGCCGELRIQFEGFQLVSETRVVRAWSGGFAVEFSDLGSEIRSAVDRLPDDEIDEDGAA